MRMNTIDIIILVFLAFSIIRGAIRGLFKSVIGLGTLAGSVAVGYFTAPLISPKAVDWLYPRLEEKLIAYTEAKFGLVPGENFEETIKPTLQPYANTIVWVLISVFAFILLEIICNAIHNSMKEKPVINAMNRLLGACFGLVVAVAICFGLVYAAAKLGVSEVLADKLNDSMVYNMLLSFVPDGVILESKIIEIPFIGEINLEELFRFNAQ